jgi:hypothetical protein
MRARSASPIRRCRRRYVRAGHGGVAKLPEVPSLGRISRFLSRHRRIVALAGVTITLGVAALNVHAALPPHHDDHGTVTVCVAALSIAVLAAIGWRPKRASLPRRRLALLPLSRATSAVTADPPLHAARAGPSGTVVLRR